MALGDSESSEPSEPELRDQIDRAPESLRHDCVGSVFHLAGNDSSKCVGPGSNRSVRVSKHSIPSYDRHGIRRGNECRDESADSGRCRLRALMEFKRFFPVLWAGFWLNAVSGVVLLIGYPTKALTNPMFYLKLVFIGLGIL